jgi:hypothetical protein
MPQAYSNPGELPLCEWHQCRGCSSPAHFRDRAAIQWWLRNLVRDPLLKKELRRLVLAQEVPSSLSAMSDDQIVEQAASMIGSGRLLICGSQGSRGATTTGLPRAPGRSPEERVIQSLRSKDKEFPSQGRRFRFIRAAQWATLPKDGRYEIVPSDEAREIIGKIVALPTVSQTDKPPLREAMGILSDTNAPQIDRGLLLLRIVPMRYIDSAGSRPALTPSQLARIRERHWIEIQVIDEDNNPVSGVSYLILTPDGQDYSGVTDSEGLARVDNIVPGQCKISFPELDRDAWRAA